MTTITSDFLQSQTWRFARSEGEIIHPVMVFLSDGTLRPNGSAETRWAIENGVLIFYTDTGEASTKFTNMQRVAGGGFRLSGRFLLNENAFSYHFLDNETANPPPKESRLNASMSLTGESDTLLVIFNSAGQPVEGRENRWEFYHLPNELGLDAVRFAEARSPATFYLDKTRLIQGMLSSILSSGRYSDVVMVGMSSGGYMSILLAELICGGFPRTKFRTFSINPQTAHSVSHREFVTRYTEFGWTPLLLSEFALSLRDCEMTDLPTIMEMNQQTRGNVEHAVYFDAGNVSEAYHASLIGGRAGVTLHPQELGLPHYASCISMFEKRLIQDAVASLVAVHQEAYADAGV